MSQINFRIEDKLDQFISFMSEREKKSKAAISKEIFLKGIHQVMLPYLAKLYQSGTISIKEIAKITQMHPAEVIEQIAQLIDDIEINPNLIQYSEEIGQKLLPFLQEAKKNEGISLKGTINIKEK